MHLMTVTPEEKRARVGKPFGGRGTGRRQYRVATPEGAERYGQPIGTIITLDENGKVVGKPKAPKPATATTNTPAAATSGASNDAQRLQALRERYTVREYARIARGDTDGIDVTVRDAGLIQRAERATLTPEQARERYGTDDTIRGGAAAARVRRPGTLGPTGDAEYERAYRRGWAAATRGGDALDRADSRGEPEAWYDAYYDMAAGRQQWHTPTARSMGLGPNDDLPEPGEAPARQTPAQRRVEEVRADLRERVNRLRAEGDAGDGEKAQHAERLAALAVDDTLIAGPPGTPFVGKKGPGRGYSVVDIGTGLSMSLLGQELNKAEVVPFMNRLAAATANGKDDSGPLFGDDQTNKRVRTWKAQDGRSAVDTIARVRAELDTEKGREGTFAQDRWQEVLDREEGVRQRQGDRAADLAEGIAKRGNDLRGRKATLSKAISGEPYDVRIREIRPVHPGSDEAYQYQKDGVEPVLVIFFDLEETDEYGVPRDGVRYLGPDERVKIGEPEAAEVPDEEPSDPGETDEPEPAREDMDPARAFASIASSIQDDNREPGFDEEAAFARLESFLDDVGTRPDTRDRSAAGNAARAARMAAVEAAWADVDDDLDALARSTRGDDQEDALRLQERVRDLGVQNGFSLPMKEQRERRAALAARPDSDLPDMIREFNALPNREIDAIEDYEAEFLRRGRNSDGTAVPDTAGAEAIREALDIIPDAENADEVREQASRYADEIADNPEGIDAGVYAADLQDALDALADEDVGDPRARDQAVREIRAAIRPEHRRGRVEVAGQLTADEAADEPVVGKPLPTPDPPMPPAPPRRSNRNPPGAPAPIERDADGNYVLYHGTSAANAEQIRRDGLVPPDGVQPATWYMLTSSREQAERYAQGDDKVVLEFRIPPDRVRNSEEWERGGEPHLLWAGAPHDVYGYAATAFAVNGQLPADYLAENVSDGPVGALPPMTDAEYAERTDLVERSVREALAAGLDTESQYKVDGVWTAERRAQHREIVDALYAAAADVPRDRKAIVSGGLGGSGKGTVLKGPAGVDQSQYLTIDPDAIKEMMVDRGMAPTLDGLTPMESAALVHEESSYLSELLRERAQVDGTNLILDMTMGKRSTVEKKLAGLAAAGYDKPRAIFVTVPLERSVERALARHRRGVDRARSGENLRGGRYVPPSVIRLQADEEYGSKNRRIFMELRREGAFSEAAEYDNGGAEPVLVPEGVRAADLPRGTRVMLPALGGQPEEEGVVQRRRPESQGGGVEIAYADGSGLRTVPNDTMLRVLESEPDADSDGPVTINFARRRTSISTGDGTFGQDIEPAGRYMVDAEGGRFDPTDWTTGTVTFQKPLRIPFGGGYAEDDNWKRVLSARYGGLTGLPLSRAIRADGYDGIITFDKYGTQEIIDLTAIEPARPARPRRQRQRLAVTPRPRRRAAAEAAEPTSSDALLPDAIDRDTPTARPVLYTYQRRNIVALGLDNHEDPNVAQAARRLRHRKPLTGPQLEAMTRALYEASQEPGIGLRQQRSRQRAAQAVKAAAGRLGGVENLPDIPTRDAPVAGQVRAFIPGDYVVLPGGIQGKIFEASGMMSGRLARVSIVHDDGVIREHVLDSKAEGYLLPDLPEPEPTDARSVTDEERDRFAEDIGVLDAMLRRSEINTFTNNAITIRYGGDDADAMIARLRQAKAGLIKEQPEYLRDTLIGDEAEILRALGVTSASERQLLLPIIRKAFQEVNARALDKMIAAVEDGEPLPDEDTRRYFLRLANLFGRDNGSDLEVDPSVQGQFPDLAAALVVARDRLRETGALGDRDALRMPTAAERAQVRGNATETYVAGRKAFVAELRKRLPAGAKAATSREEVNKIGSDLLYGDFLDGLFSTEWVKRQYGFGNDTRRLTSIQNRLTDEFRTVLSKTLGDMTDELYEIERNEPNSRKKVDTIFARYEARDRPARTTANPWRDSEAKSLNEALDNAEEKALRHLAVGGDVIEGDRLGGPTGEATDLPPETGTFAEQINALQDYLGDPARIGQTRVRRFRYEEISRERLAAGEVPNFVEEETWEDDIAADGGPGHIATRQQEAVKRIGTLVREMALKDDKRVNGEIDALTGGKTVGDYLRPFESFVRLRSEDERIARLNYQGWERGVRRDVANDLGINYNKASEAWLWGSDAEAKAKGKADMDKVNDRVKAHPDYETRHAPLERASAEWLKALRSQQSAEAEIRRIRQSATLRVLERIRGFGPAADANLELSNEGDDDADEGVIADLHWTERFYPTEWLRKQREGGAMKALLVGRGYHNFATKEIALSGAGESRKDTALHEVGHRMEAMIPGLVQMEHAFLWARTSLGPIGARDREEEQNLYGDTSTGFGVEKSRRDNFREPYTGKQYGTKAFEVFTTGIESLFGGSLHMGREGDYDTDMMDFIIGSLASLGHTEDREPLVDEPEPAEGPTPGIYGRDAQGNYFKVNPDGSGLFHYSSGSTDQDMTPEETRDLFASDWFREQYKVDDPAAYEPLERDWPTADPNFMVMRISGAYTAVVGDLPDGGFSWRLNNNDGERFSLSGTTATAEDAQEAAREAVLGLIESGRLPRGTEVPARPVRPSLDLASFKGYVGKMADLPQGMQRALRDLYEIEVDGYRFEIDSVNGSGGDGPYANVQIEGNIYDSDGRVAGTWERAIRSGGIVEHSFLRLNEDVRGQRVGDVFFRQSIEKYKAYGLRGVTVHADIDVGAYAWAQRGYEWDPRVAEANLEMAGRWIYKVGEIIDLGDDEQAAEFDKWNALIDRAINVGEVNDIEGLRLLPSPKELANAFGRFRTTETLESGVEIPMWPGKKAFLGSPTKSEHWYGLLPLQDGDDAYKIREIQDAEERADEDDVDEDDDAYA